MMSSDSVESLSTIVSDDSKDTGADLFEMGEPDSSLFEIGEPDDLALVVEEPTQEVLTGTPTSHATSACKVNMEVEIIEEEPTQAIKRRLSVSDHILGHVQKLLKKTTADGGAEFLPYESGVTDYQPTVSRPKYEAILATDDFDDDTEDKPKKERFMLGYSAYHGSSLIPAEVRDNWEHFVANTPTAAPRLSVAPPAGFQWGNHSFY